MKSNETLMAFIRLIVTIVFAINAVLTAKGMNPIPFDESVFTELATYAASAISGLWVWWKNNNVTEKAKYAQETLIALKTDFIEDGEEVDEDEVA